MRRLAGLGAVAALAVAAGAEGAGDSFRFTATLAGVPKLSASYAATLTGSRLAWKLTATARGTSAELVGLGRTVTLCRPCAASAKGSIGVAAAQAQLLQQGKVAVRLHTAKGALSGRLKLVATIGPGSGATTPTVTTSGPAGTTWAATAVALRGQNGNRFEFSCPPNSSSGAGPVWGGGTESFTDTSAVCPAAVMTGDILLQGGGLVVIEIRPGQSSYVGTTSNGITSQSFGPAPGSFVVIHDS